jgi:hypothetical protein
LGYSVLFTLTLTLSMREREQQVFLSHGSSVSLQTPLVVLRCVGLRFSLSQRERVGVRENEHTLSTTLDFLAASDQ